MVDGAFGDDFFEQNRSWDDFGHLGHPPKFCRVQDASSGNNSSFWYHVGIILMTNHAQIIKYHAFSKTNDINKKKGPCQECTTQKSGVGTHPNPYFQFKPITNWKNTKIRIRSTIPISESEDCLQIQSEHQPCMMVASSASPA